MRNRGSRQNLEGRVRTKTAPAPPVPKPTRPPRTAATAPTGASQATLITAQKSGQPVMDRLAFIAIMGGSIVVAPLVSEAQRKESACSPRGRLHLDSGRTEARASRTRL
jgi:hypothetical protein